MASSKYAGMSKDNLTAEIKTRRAAGRKLSVDLRGDEDTLRAALDTDDVENGEFVPGVSTDDSALAGSGTLAPKPEANAPPAGDSTKLPPVKPSEVAGVPAVKLGKLTSQIANTPEVSESAPTQPSEEEWAGSELYKHKGDTFTYQVVRRETDPFEKPVKARVPRQESGHPGLYWEGTVAEFESAFTKV